MEKHEHIVPTRLKRAEERVLLSQQASVRRGPRASATSLFTVSLAESEASAFLANRVCVSPKAYISNRKT